MKVNILLLCMLAVTLSMCVDYDYGDEETDTPDTETGSTDTQDTGETDTDSTPLADGDGAICRYIDPHSDAEECRVYAGAWTGIDKRRDCGDPMFGMAEAGTLSDDPCTTDALLGVCSADLGDGRSITTYFYAGPPDVLSSMCADFLKGTWDGIGIDPDNMRAATQAALDAMVSDSEVQVNPECQDIDCLVELVEEGRGWFEFAPVGAAPSRGIIFFPGGNVDPRAYAVTAREMASRGYFVVIASYGESADDRLSKIKWSHLEIAEWFLGGHSHGGVTILDVAFKNPAVAQGLFLWASSGYEGADLSAETLPVIAVSGTLDGLADPQSVVAGLAYLPSGTVHHPIAGGNHAQFGDYGDQDGDNAATISREAQQAETVDSTLAFIASIGSGR